MNDAEAFLQRSGPDVITAVVTMTLLLATWRLAASGTAWRAWDVAEAARMFQHRPAEKLPWRARVFGALAVVPPLGVAGLSVVAHDQPTESTIAVCVIFAITMLIVVGAAVNDVQRVATGEGTRQATA